MLYLGEEHLRMIGEPWRELVDRIQETVRIMDQGSFAQPLKPYLRYGDPRNRIIAMPAYIGGSVATAGLKWIASFPGNLASGLPRAHSVTILNDAATGEPYAIVNSALVSAIRTAAVSGLMLREWLRHRLLDQHGDDAEEGLRIGIIGLGPIGRMHQAMALSLFEEHIDYLMLYDIRGVRPEEPARQRGSGEHLADGAGHLASDTRGSGEHRAARAGHLASDARGSGKHRTARAGHLASSARGSGEYRAADCAQPPSEGRAKIHAERPRRKAVPVRLAGSWQELYRSCNVIITCTVSSERYIHTPPAPGTLLLDVSLRDYSLEALQGIRSIVVDDWTEVCRENTDIELLHREAGLTEHDVFTLRDVVCRDAIAQLSSREPLLFCPMGMAAFDVAVAEWYVRKGEELGIGVRL